MPKLQMLSAFINLGGDRDNVVHRDQFNPISYPEALVLRVIHGGPDHVHTLVETKRVEANLADERQRLVELYGSLVNEVFPSAGGTLSVPMADDSLPTLGDMAAASAAAAKALATRRARKAAANPAPAEKSTAPVSSPEPEAEEVPVTPEPDPAADETLDPELTVTTFAPMPDLVGTSK